MGLSYDNFLHLAFRLFGAFRSGFVRATENTACRLSHSIDKSVAYLSAGVTMLQKGRQGAAKFGVSVLHSRVGLMLRRYGCD